MALLVRPAPVGETGAGWCVLVRVMFSDTLPVLMAHVSSAARPRFALAPMATLSHEALRLLIHEFGDPDEYFSEMIHAPSFVHGGRFESWYVRTSPCPERMVWQLTGGSEGPMVKAASMLRAYGGIGLDINMGCSAPDIAKTGAGIAWMGKPLAEVASLVRSVRAEFPARLSVKCRLGEDENYPRLLAFCRMLIDEGAELITLHPRLRRQGYARPAMRDYVGRLASDLPVPVYGNGDVSSAEDARSFLEKSHCAGLMIGRAAVQKPWIFSTISGLPPAASLTAPDGRVDHRAVSDFFLSRLRECQPEEFHISRAHRFFFYYCDNFSFAHHIKMRIQKTKTPDEIGGLLDDYFVQVEADRFSPVC